MCWRHSLLCFSKLATVFFLSPLDCEWQAHGRLCGVSGQWRGRGGNREWRWWERCLVVKELYHRLQLYSFSTVTAFCTTLKPRLEPSEEGRKNPAWNPDPYPEPAHHLPGAEDAQPGAVSFGLWSQEACLLHQPPGPRSDHSCWHVGLRSYYDF